MDLFDDHYLVSVHCQCLGIFLPVLFGKTYFELASLIHPSQIEHFLANYGIVIEHFIELAQLEEHYGIVMLGFHLPILTHCRRKVLPFLRGNVQSRWVVIGIIRPSALCISDMFVFNIPWFAFIYLLLTHLGFLRHSFLALITFHWH